MEEVSISISKQNNPTVLILLLAHSDMNDIALLKVKYNFGLSLAMEKSMNKMPEDR